MLNLLINTADPEQDGLLDSFFSSGKAISQDLVRNDKVLAFQIVPVVPSDRETQLWDADHLSTDTYLVAVGNEDEPPTGGTWPLTLGANTATAIAYNVTAAALETALMAAGFGTLTVSLLQAGVYQVTWTANGAVAQMTSGANTLTPDAGVTINVVAAGSVSTQAVQVITLRQSVVAAAAPATQLPAAGIAATIARAGSGTENKIYSLTMTPGTYGGTFSLTVTAATGSAQGLGVVDANISAADFAALLATQTVIASTDNVSVQRVGTVLNVEFIGTQGLSNVPVIAVANIDLLAPKGVSGTINFNTIPLNRAFWNTTETELTYRFAVRRTRATGEEREFYNASVTLKRNLIDASTMVAVFTGGITVGATGISGGTSGRVLYDNAGVVGEYAISGTGSVAMTTSPTFVTPTLGAATATSINGNTITAGSGTLSLASGSIAVSATAPINTSAGGYIKTDGELGGFAGGLINTQGGTSAVGGYIRTHAGVLGTGVGAAGGYINTSNGGGYINTSSGGGSIDTTQGGSITTGAGALLGPAGSGTIATNETISGGTLAGSFTTLAGTSSATLGVFGTTSGSVVFRTAGHASFTTTLKAATPTASYTVSILPTGNVTMTLPSTSFTAARTDAAQTFTGVQTFSSVPVIPSGTSTAPGIVFASSVGAGSDSGLWDGGGSGRIGFITANTNRMNLAGSAYNLASNLTVNFNSATNIGGYSDTTLRRGGIGLLNLCAGTASSDSTTTANGQLGHGCSIFTTTAVENLPASPAAGWVAAVNNALAPTVGVAVADGGAAFALVCHNGTSWIVLSI